MLDLLHGYGMRIKRALVSGGFAVRPDKEDPHTVVSTLGLVNPRTLVYAGEELDEGDLIAISGWDAGGGVPQAKKAAADATEMNERAAIFVAAEDISNEDIGYAVGVHILEEQDTDAEDAGTPVYLDRDTNQGEWTFSLTSHATGEAIQQVGVSLVKDDSEGTVLLMPFYTKVITEEA